MARSFVESSALALLPTLALLPAIALPQQSGSTEAKPRVELSGEHRSRYEYLDEEFRPGFPGANRVFAMRTSVVLQAHFTKLDVVAELMDSRMVTHADDDFIDATMVNTLEPIQAHVAFNLEDLFMDGSTSSLRVGRITLDVGKRRLVARNRHRNDVNTFAGIDWQWRGGDGRGIRLLYVKPMVIEPLDRASLRDNEQEYDSVADGIGLFGGVYEPRAGISETRSELYAFELDIDDETAGAAARLDLTTIGARIYRAPEPGRFTFELEPVVQFGDSVNFVDGEAQGRSSHRAYFFHGELGYAFRGSWSPVVLFQYDEASGDELPQDGHHERFNTLFGARRFDLGPTGIYGAFARANLTTPALRVTAKPTQRIDGFVAYRWLELESARDAWTVPRLRDPTGASGKSLGRQVELSIIWRALPGRLALESGLVYFHKGRFAREAPGQLNPAGHASHAYMALTASF